MALCTKGAEWSQPGERHEILRAGPLKRCLGEFFPCVGICECLFSDYSRHFVVVVVQECREVDHGLYSRGARVCFVVCPVNDY